MLLVRCAYMFVVCATEDSENYPDIGKFVCVKIPIKPIESSSQFALALSPASQLPQETFTIRACGDLLWELACRR